MRRWLRVVTVLLVVAVVIQVYFAAFGVFTAPTHDAQSVLHQMNGRMVLPLLYLLVSIAAALAIATGRLIGRPRAAASLP
jgi:type IV secretory pathway TrbL component